VDASRCLTAVATSFASTVAPTIATTIATVAALACLTGCGGSAPSAATASHSPSPTHSPSAETQPAAQLSVAQAGTVFAAFLPQFNRLPSDPSLVNRLTTGPLSASDAFLKGRAGPAVGTLSGEHVLVPYLTGYPRWFVADGTASDGSGILFVMVQQSPGGAWRAGAELFDLSAPAQILPDLKLAGLGVSGLSNAAQADDASLQMPPSGLAAAYAQAENQAGSAGRDFTAGAYTTERVRSDRQAARQALTQGWKLTDTMSAANEPLYGLDLPSGDGALVIFFTTERYSWTATSASAVIPHGSTTTFSAPPAALLAQLGITAATAGLRVTATSIDQNLAFVGPPHTKAVILTNNGLEISLSRSTASP
jgi:hypothetical protein